MPLDLATGWQRVVTTWSRSDRSEDFSLLRSFARVRLGSGFFQGQLTAVSGIFGVLLARQWRAAAAAGVDLMDRLALQFAPALRPCGRLGRKRLWGQWTPPPDALGGTHALVAQLLAPLTAVAAAQLSVGRSAHLTGQNLLADCWIGRTFASVAISMPSGCAPRYQFDGTLGPSLHGAREPGHSASMVGAAMRWPLPHLSGRPGPVDSTEDVGEWSWPPWYPSASWRWAPALAAGRIDRPARPGRWVGGWWGVFKVHPAFIFGLKGFFFSPGKL